LLSAGALALTPIPSPARIGADRPSLWRDAGFGFGYILRRRPLLWLLAAFTAANFAGTFVTVYLPLLVRFNLAAPGLTFSDALALLTSVGSIGGLLGGAAVSAWGGLRNRRILGVLVPLIFLGAGQLAFGLSRSLYLAAAMLAVQFAAGPVANAHSHAIWQGQVPPALQGRVFAVRRLIAQFTAPAGAALAGWAGAAFNPGTVVAVLGVALAVFCLGLLFSQSLHRVEDRAWLDSLAL
ncbi:MAG TPA: MFS transporter, partial [Bacillota bacterium]|nr:MFS transporter [Bacillota bacterium]